MVEVLDYTKNIVDKRFLYRVASKVLLREGKKNMDLSVALVDLRRMTEISKTYKGKAEPANVLSFPIKELGLGEVVLCKSVIADDAKKYGITIKKALAFMMVHGILHLLGYSHKNMQQKESQYLSCI